ncbi:hypothetical protein CTI12_AA525310 [Artemisia annua]|uniref:Uncharacterized protein n=1 Tax=Artemisia annua TaxID=35608 RepID=A0A2U1L6C7_ARTAN|nr:hypothetical protein CTI12_AA525310 [Artemisia annua]
MLSLVNIRTTYGLPLCLSGVTRHDHLHFSKEIADHDRRREEMRRAKPESEHVIRSSDLIHSIGDNDDHDHMSVLNTHCIAKAA